MADKQYYKDFYRNLWDNPYPSDGTDPVSIFFTSIGVDYLRVLRDCDPEVIRIYEVDENGKRKKDDNGDIAFVEHPLSAADEARFVQAVSENVKWSHDKWEEKTQNRMSNADL